MNKLLWTIFGYLCLACPLQAGKLTGKITDAQGEGLPFATVYAKRTGEGATANEAGEYALTLPAGTHILVFQYVGYKVQTVQVEMTNENLLLDIPLESEQLTLPTVELVTIDNDPARTIIRKAQAKRKYYLKEEIKSYQTRAYIKSMQRLNKRPTAIMGQSIQVDTGVVYFSESLSEVSFKQPDKYFEKIISSKVSGKSQAFSFNQASGAWLNLYDNISGQEITERGIVSPIATNAFAYYRYRLEGAFYQDGQLINKIRLIPKRKSTPAYGGYIYIIEDTWRIHSAELVMRKGQMEFVDSASVYQVYAPVQGTDIWFPLTQKAYFEFNAFGFKGNGNVIFIYSPPVLEPAFPKKHFTQEVLTVEKESNKRDSAHWETIRPIPLTHLEVREYKFRDSIAIVKETKTYKDSTDRERNRFRVLNLFWRGYTYRRSFQKLTYAFDPLPAMLQYNTVEGVAVDFSPVVRKGFGEDNRKYFTISPYLRYGFANKRLQAKLELFYYFNPQKWQYISASGGQYIEQLGRQVLIRPFANTAYTLLNKQNFQKIYEKTFLQLAYGHRLLRGFRINASWEWNERREMQNNTDYSIIKFDNRAFTPNFPTNLETTQTFFNTHRAMILGVVLSLDLGEKYAVYPEYTYTVESKYPTIRLNYRKGLAWGGSAVDYDFMMLQVLDSWNFGMVGESEWEVEAGKFLSTRRIEFIDYRHFLGNQTLFGRNDIRQYFLLDYYLYSTRQTYLKAHFEHHFNGFLFNGIPLIKKLKWQEVLSMNFLHTPAVGQYWEFGIGVEHIFKVLRIDWVTAFQARRQASTGVRFGIGF